MRPFEFVIPRRPVSQQARRRQRLDEWKQFVRSEAEKYWTDEHTKADGPVSITIIVFYDEVALDIDNVIKPIQDALVGLVYDDDNLVTDAISRRRYMNTDFILDDVSPIFAASIEGGKEFVYVLVTDAPSQERFS